MAERPLDTSARIHRLLAILRHAAANPEGVAIAELCDRFGLRRDQLLKELGLATMVGAESANYDDMPFEVVIDPEEVSVRLFSLDRPLRLTPEEGLALVAAADAISEGEEDDSPLRRGLAKVAAVLGIDPDDSVDVEMSVDGGPIGRMARDVAIDGGTVTFRYWTYGSDEIGDRTVEPWDVFLADGLWYLVGHDVERKAPRRFRLDRISDLAVQDRHASAPRPDRIPADIDLGTVPRATLELPGHARWVAEAFAIDSLVEAADGRFAVTLPVAGRSWLARLMLRVGDGAKLVSMDPALGATDVVAEITARILARYEGDGEPAVGSET